MPVLGIVVPYRDRKAHLDIFVPHMRSFLRGQREQGGIETRILVVEQTEGLSFNRASLLNVGYMYLRDRVDYICFQDVDTLPVTADYSCPDQPSMIVTDGLPFKPEMIQHLFSGCIVMQKEHFELANGFSNTYWGWGYEDVDLRERMLRRGLQPSHRKGLFKLLAHVDRGRASDGKPSADHIKNQKQYLDRWLQKYPWGWLRKGEVSPEWESDGLNSLEYDEIVSPVQIYEADSVSGDVVVEHVVVAFNMRETLP